MNVVATAQDVAPEHVAAHLLAELARFKPDPALAQLLSATLRQAQQDAAQLKLAHLKIAALTLELAHHKRLRFANKSEAFSPEQRHLFEESWHADAGAIEAQVAHITAAPRKRQRAGRQPLPAHLPRIEHRHEPQTCTCGQCGQDLVKIGEDVSEQLDVEPARFFVHRHIRPQYACRACQSVTAEPVPAAVIDGGLAAPGLHAWVVTQKFLDHLPLYRIEQITTRYGVPIARSTLAQWVGRIGVALQALADRLAQLLRQRAILHADETPVQQLDPGQGKTRRAYLWAYRSNNHDPGPPIIVFDYQPGRAGSHAQDFLQDWRGHLMVDDYAGYKALFRSGITELACLAHARRKFFELHAVNRNPIAGEALARIAQLYGIEEAGKALSGADRAHLRQCQAQPKLDALHDWLLQTRPTVAQGSALAKAIDYSLKRWPALVRYAASGVLPIDNNPIENAIRPIAIGKKNWLFAGSERAGKRAAAIQSLLGTAKLNGIEPCAWLKDTLEKLPVWPNSRIDELLPLRSSSNT
jgi:transposase